MRGRRESRWHACADEREKAKPHCGPLLTEGGDEKGIQNFFDFLIEFYRRSPVLMVLHLAGTLIAWFAPDDALTRWPALKIIVTGVGEIFPLVPKAIEKSLFPDVTALYFTLMLSATPLRIFEALRLCYAERDRIILGYLGYSWKRKVLAFLVAFIFLSGSVFLLIFHGQYFDWNFVSVAQSKLWLGMVGPLFAGGYLIICFVAGVVAMLSLSCCVFIVDRG